MSDVALKLPLEIEDIKAILPHRYPVPPRRPHRRARGGPPDRRAQERHLQRALLHRRARAASPCCPPRSSPRPWPRPAPSSSWPSPRTARASSTSWASTACATGGRWWPATRSMLEATVVRLRSKMGTLARLARVDGKVVCEGQMTFALGERPAARPEAGGRAVSSPAPSPSSASARGARPSAGSRTAACGSTARVERAAVPLDRPAPATGCSVDGRPVGDETPARRARVPQARGLRHHARPTPAGGHRLRRSSATSAARWVGLPGRPARPRHLGPARSSRTTTGWASG